MRLDKARRDEPTAEIDRFGLRCQLGLDRDDLAVLDPDVGGTAVGVNEPRALENEVHSVPSSLRRSFMLAEIAANERWIGAQVRGRARMPHYP